MLEQRADLVRDRRVEEAVVLVGLQQLAFQERDHLVQHRGIAGRADIVCDGVGEPRPIVGDARAHALTRMRQPPMLDVALDELSRRRAQQVLARHGRLRGDQRHAVLQLVAEAVGTARLVERRARPDAAGQRLIQQPAVQHDIHRPVGGLHLDRAEHIVPVAADLATARRRDLPCGSVQSRSAASRALGGFAEEEDDLDAGVRRRATTVVRSAPHGSRPAPTGVGERRRTGERRRAAPVCRCGR